MVTVSRKKKWLRRVGQVSLGAGEAFLTGGMSLLYALHKKNQQRDDTLEEVHEAETPGETEIGEDEPAPGNVTFYRNVTKKVPISKKFLSVFFLNCQE